MIPNAGGHGVDLIKLIALEQLASAIGGCGPFLLAGFTATVYIRR